MSELNIFQRMSAITAELQTVAKNLTVDAGKSKYKAVSERDVLDAVKPIEAKNGIYSYPIRRSVLESQTLESENEYNGKINKKTTFFTRIETVYRFVNVDKPDEYIETTVFSEGIDSQDKGSGKAMTYADKYALMKAYKISTGDDPDQEASKDTEYRKIEKPIDLLCEDCGNTILPYIGGNGKEVSVRKHVGRTNELFGCNLCRDCVSKRMNNAN